MPIKDKDLEVWTNYTSGITQKVGKKPTALGATKKALLKKPDMTKKAVTVSKPLPVTNKKNLVNLPNPTFSRQRERALGDGKVDIDARIDLHAMTQEQAFTALGTFLCRNVKAKNHTLLVITGKGENNNGVLRKNLESWLLTMPYAENIKAFRPAGIKHGGKGAFYVILR